MVKKRVVTNRRRTNTGGNVNTSRARQNTGRASTGNSNINNTSNTGGRTIKQGKAGRGTDTGIARTSSGQNTGLANIRRAFNDPFFSDIDDLFSFNPFS